MKINKNIIQISLFTFLFLGLISFTSAQCVDDNFENDDTKESAVNHNEDGNWPYKLCSDDSSGID